MAELSAGLTSWQWFLVVVLFSLGTGLSLSIYIVEQSAAMSDSQERGSWDPANFFLPVSSQMVPAPPPPKGLAFPFLWGNTLELTQSGTSALNEKIVFGSTGHAHP